MSHAEAKRLEHEFSPQTGRKGKDRVIIRPGAALTIVQDLVRKHPMSLLMRTRWLQDARSPV